MGKVRAAHDKDVFPFCRPEDRFGDGFTGPDVLGPHHDGDKGETPEGLLQERQLNLDGMLRRMGLAVGVHHGVRPEDRARQFGVYGDHSERRFIPPGRPDRGAAEQDAMARPDHHDGVIPLSLDQAVAVRRDLPGVPVPRVGGNEADDPPPDGSRRGVLEIPADLAPEDPGVARVPGAGNDGFPDVLFHGDRRSATTPGRSPQGPEVNFRCASLPLAFFPACHAYPFAGGPVKRGKRHKGARGKKRLTPKPGLFKSNRF